MTSCCNAGSAWAPSIHFRAKSAHHLFDIRRMNVGITRARRKLLVGDSSTLCRYPFFVELLAYVKGVGATEQRKSWPENRSQQARKRALRKLLWRIDLVQQKLKLFKI
jgi:hypothetical protein